MNSSAHVLPALFARLAVQAWRSVHRATKVPPHKLPQSVEELDCHEEMGVERKNRKGIISVLAVKQAGRGKRLKSMKHAKSQFYASNARYDPMRQQISLAPRKKGAGRT